VEDCQAMVRSFELPGGKLAPMAARLALAGLSDLLEARFRDISLLASELVTNGVLQAQLGPEDSLQLVVTVDGDNVRVEVRTQVGGQGTVHLAFADSRLDYSVRLLDGLADRWGSSKGNEICIWFEVGLLAESDR
jgi:hypothetical protein